MKSSSSLNLERTFSKYVHSTLSKAFSASRESYDSLGFQISAELDDIQQSSNIVAGITSLYKTGLIHWNEVWKDLL